MIQLDCPIPRLSILGAATLGLPSAARGWHVVETLARREMFAVQNLERQNISTFWPRFWKTRRHARRQDRVLASLFPGYIFVQIDPEWTIWRPINSTFGVKRLVTGVSQRPEPVPAAAMAIILARCHQGVMTSLYDEFLPGEQARITAGPLFDQLVSIECYDDKGRVRVLLNILGAKTPVTLPINSLGPV